jgi:hypothetical protein
MAVQLHFANDAISCRSAVEAHSSGLTALEHAGHPAILGSICIRDGTTPLEIFIFGNAPLPVPLASLTRWKPDRERELLAERPFLPSLLVMILMATLPTARRLCFLVRAGRRPYTPVAG